MRKSLQTVIGGLFVLLICSSVFAGEYTPDFSAYMADKLDDGQEMISAIIGMADRVDLRALQDRLYAERADRQAWHEAVVLALQEKATLTQSDIIARLDQMAADGSVEKYKTLWLGNVIIIRATESALGELVSRADVGQISPDYQIQTIEPVTRNEDEPIIAAHEIGLERINADDCWAIGITGQGRLVSNIDTGVLGTHEALTDRWAGNDPRYAGHPEWAWYDPYDTHWLTPNDTNGHGTHTMGTICGRTASGSDTIGVAIEAQWIAAAPIDRGGQIPRTVGDALLSFEWIADPDSNPGTVWDVPDVCSNSWGVLTSHGYPPCDPTFYSVIDACEAVGVVVVFAAGNEDFDGLRRPADRAATLYSTFSVGAVDGNNPDMPIADFSSRGPSNCTPDGNPTFKPEVSTPGVSVRSSDCDNNTDYATMSGTSMACPHVAGVVALVRQANPSLSSEQVKQIIYETAVECNADNEPGEDNTWGMGVVDAFAAVQRAFAYLQGWGTLGGVVTDQASGLPIAGARISVQDRPWGTSTRADGSYYLFMPADTAWTIRVSNDPTHLPIFDTVTVVENDTIFMNYALEGKVPVTLKASFANPQDASYRSFYLKGSWNADGFYDAGWSGPLITIRDDGNAPDQTPEDGVFTGQVLLARDLAHTYSWAIYSENYGGEAARLQNGTDFQILDLTPPDVPTLPVAPAGDNNWVITAFGDNGLNLDLTQGFNNQPNKWGATAILDSGTTYTFRFRVMHSTVASYGLGGIGGLDLVFTCLYTDNYEFSFDDRDDSYRIRLIGHPEPTNLAAQSGFEFRVPLRWRFPEATARLGGQAGPPAQVESPLSDVPDELAKGAEEPIFPPMLLGRGGPDSAGYEWIDSDEPDGPFFEWVDITMDGTEITPWPHGTVDDGYTDPMPMGMNFNFYGIDYSDIVVTTNGWISFLPQTSSHILNEGIPNNTTPQAIVAVEWDDLDGGTDGHCYYYYDAAANRFIVSWINWPYYATPYNPHDLQVILNGNSGSITTQYRNNADIYQSDITVGIENEAGTVGLQVTYDAAYLHNDLAVRFATGPEGTTPVHYNLYRAESPNVPVEPGYLVNGSIDGTLNYYTDAFNVVNGVTYYYKLTAVWSDSVASPPSNEASGTPANLVPLAPFNLQGSVFDRTVSVTWQQDNTIGDRDHFNVFKQFMPSGEQVFVGSTPDTSYSFDIPIGEDGVYSITVTAVDNGTPPLESGHSGAILLPVGHLPPTDLVAVSGEEFAVPVRWNPPGAWRAGAVEPGDPPMTLGRGGPDGYGYEWIDSDESDGPTFNWIDITGDGIEISPWPNGTVDDGWTNLIPMGMDFEFYGIIYNSICVGTNGWISFMAQTTSHITNEAIPNNTTPNAVIAVEWDDMDGMTDGHCYYKYDPLYNRFIVSWVNWSYGATPYNPHDFQVILNGNSGAVVTQYRNNADIYQTDITVGIENETGTDGLQVTYNNAYLHNDLAIRFATGPEGFQPVHYKLYRSETPGFVPDPANLINGSINGDMSGFIDQTGLVNGTPYYYRLTAVWEDSVESIPTNEATGTPANHPPQPPINLAGQAVGFTISVTWSFTDLVGDFDHFNVYKQLVPGGSTVLVGSTADTSYSFDIPSNEDGVYLVTVRTVDDGNPPLESVPSDGVFFPVGHLPPSSLVAISGEEFAVPLAWSLPGSWRLSGDRRAPTRASVAPETPEVPESEIKDVEEPAYPPMLLGRGGPDAFGYEWIDSDEPDGPNFNWIDITGDGIEISPWPNGTVDDGWTNLIPMGMDFEFYGITYNSVCVGTNGWVSFEQQTTSHLTNEAIPNNTTPDAIVAVEWDDLNGGTDGHCYYYYDALRNRFIVSWINWPYYASPYNPHDFQVILNGNSGSIITQYQNNADVYQSDITVGIENETGTDGLQVTYNLDYLHNDMAVRYGTSPDGYPPVHYKLYRSTTSGFPIEPQYLINGSIGGDQSSYRDQSGVQNGTPYYYKLTAVWPDSVESPASNEATGTPANHAPEAPSNLAGTVNNLDVSLHWSFTNLMGDLDHFNIYKRLIPGGVFTLAGTSPDTAEVVTIPTGEDGTYAFAVCAVDNGTPQMEGPYSNIVTLPVGLLPAQNLVATSDQDGYVPLRWSEPGLRPRATIVYDDGVVDNAYYFYAMINLAATMFVPPSYPTVLDSVQIKLLAEGDPYWPWPDDIHQPVGISVFLDNGSGQPQTDPELYVEATMGTEGGWLAVDIPDVTVPSGNFWVALNNISDLGSPPAPGEGFGLDEILDYGPNQWKRVSGVWSLQTSYGDHMIRAVIIDNGRMSAGDDLASAPRKVLAYDSAPAGDVTAAVANRANIVRMPVPQLGGNGDTPRPLDTEVLAGYAIYRSTSPNVQPLPQNRIRTYLEQGLATTYNDSSVTNGTTYYYIVTAAYDNGDIQESPPTNEASATPRMGARMVLNPLSYNVTGMVGQITTENLNISNPGGMDLQFSITAQTDALLGVRPLPEGTSCDVKSHPWVKPVSEQKGAEEPVNPPMLAGRGGPDNFGYIWIDSDEPGGPTYSWVDISGVGTPISWPHGTVDDGWTDPIPMGMTFNYYGVDYANISVSTNGWVSFLAVTSAYLGNAAIPSAGNPNAIVAVEWDDLDGGAAGQCYYYYDSAQNRFIVSWVSWSYYSAGGEIDPHDLQVIIYGGSGKVVSQYANNFGTWQADVTVGIENESGTDGLQVTYNAAYLHNDMAINYVTGWLSTNPSSGTVIPAGNQNVSVIFDASYLTQGVYTGSLRVVGRDVNHEVGQVFIPVTFHVNPVSIEEAVDLPREFALAQNYPNPFNPTTEIRFELPIKSRVDLRIFNVLGQQVKALIASEMEAGYRSVIWDGKDDSGAEVSSGTYFYILRAGDHSFSKRMTLIR